MNVCVIGTGGREHTIVWKLAQSASVESIYAIPGNDAMANIATVVSMDWHHSEELISFLKSHQVDLVVVGPEAPLVEGLVDVLEREGIAVFGPSKRAAQLEGSKVFAKKMMERYHIPTAKYEVFHDVQSAKACIDAYGLPVVIKADGLAAGKGVVVAMTKEDAYEAIDDMLSDNRFGEAGSTVVVEEFMEGEEVSLLAFVDGKVVVPMVAAQDHKRIFDGDQGPNTGGMGAYAPAPILTKSLEQEAMKTILLPIVQAMAQEGMPFKGCLYAGLMITNSGPKVVEFNARFGDPETQVILPLLASDLGTIMWACATGTLQEDMVSWHDRSAACVVLASKGYPISSHKGDVIRGNLTDEENTLIFHAGTKKDKGEFVTDGGRVLGVVGIAPRLDQALQGAYHRIEQIRFSGMQYRKDIGHKAFT